MSVYESDWLRPASRPAGERKFRLLSVVAVALFFAYLGATLAGAPRQTSSLIFNIAVLPVPFVAWWTVARASDDLRPTWLRCAWAATLWLAGSLVWYGFFLANGSNVPPSPGLLCAYGALTADVAYDFVATVMRPAGARLAPSEVA